LVRRRIFTAALTTFLAAVSLTPPVFAVVPSSGDARALIEDFHGALLKVMKEAKELGVKGRYAKLEPAVARHFDIPLMVALATGNHWRSAEPAARKRLAQAFRRFSAATYASRFSGFSGQSFETLDDRDGPRKTRLVRTQIRRPDDPAVSLTYVTRATPEGWRIVDVLVDDGISELAVKRSEYRSILDTSGVDGLVRSLDDKTATLLTK
jgi:phospholipid transport system substrate-binding protein